MSSTKATLPLVFGRWRAIAAVAAPIGLIAGLLVASVTEGGIATFWQAWLYAFILWFSLTMGSLALLMIHHMTCGQWSFVTQRILEACTRTLPLMIVLFIPLFIAPWLASHDIATLGIGKLYDIWVHSDSEVVENKALYLNPDFWMARAVGYFLIWGGLIWLLNRWSAKMDKGVDTKSIIKLQALSPVGVILYCVTMNFAATDWVMSLEPEWFSTIYGPLFWVSQGLTTLCFISIILSYAAEEKPQSDYVMVSHFHDLGMLITAFVVLWAYMSFSQYLITWSGNLPEEIHYYLSRSNPGFVSISLLLMFFHFLVPLLLLLFRRNKRNSSVLRKICYYILVMRMIDIFWFVNPSFNHGADNISAAQVFLYLLVFAGMGGIWLWVFFGQLSKRPLLALNDPRFYDALGREPEFEQGMEHQHA